MSQPTNHHIHMVYLRIIIILLSITQIVVADDTDKKAMLKKYCEKFGGTSNGYGCDNMPLPVIKWDEVSADNKTECLKQGSTWNACGFNLCDALSGRREAASCIVSCTCTDRDKRKRCWIFNGRQSDASKAKGTCIDAPNWHQGFAAF